MEIGRNPNLEETHGQSEIFDLEEKILSLEAEVNQYKEYKEKSETLEKSLEEARLKLRELRGY